MTRREALGALGILGASLFLNLKPEKSDEVIDKVTKVLAEYKADWMIVGSTMASALGLSIANSGVHLIGELNGVKVFYDPYLPVNELLVGYKVKTVDCGMVYLSPPDIPTGGG